MFFAEKPKRLFASRCRRQVVQQRRKLRRRLRFLGDRAEVVAARGDDRLRGRQAPEARIAFFRVEFVLLELRIEPAAFVETAGADEFRAHFPVVARHEAANLLLALDDDRQRGRLHAADGRQEEAAALAVERRHRARAVDADEPVGLRAATRGIGERLHVHVGAQVREAVADRGGRHRLQPQALDRLLGLRVLRDQAEDQLALAPRVACVDQTVDILALDQLRQHLQARLAFRDRIQIEMGRDDGQMREAPFAALDFVFLGRGDFEQVADRRRQHVFVALVVFVMLGKAAQSTRDVVRDRRLFRNDECFRHDSVY